MSALGHWLCATSFVWYGNNYISLSVELGLERVTTRVTIGSLPLVGELKGKLERIASEFQVVLVITGAMSNGESFLHY